MYRYLYFTLLILYFAGNASASLVDSRSSLNTLLGAQAINEYFERYPVNPGNSMSLGNAAPFLDSNSVVAGNGPGLVVPGVLFYGDTPALQWNGDGYQGLSTETLSDGSDPDLTVQFSTDTTAMGIDLLEYSGVTESVTATVYAPDNVTVLETVSGIALSGTTPVFFGYSDNGGIGNVTFTSTINSFSPVIDNLVFGVPVPEPTSAVILLGGILVCMRDRQWRNRGDRQANRSLSVTAAESKQHQD